MPTVLLVIVPWARRNAVREVGCRSNQALLVLIAFDAGADHREPLGEELGSSFLRTCRIRALSCISSALCTE